MLHSVRILVADILCARDPITDSAASTRYTSLHGIALFLPITKYPIIAIFLWAWFALAILTGTCLRAWIIIVTYTLSWGLRTLAAIGAYSFSAFIAVITVRIRGRLSVCIVFRLSGDPIDRRNTATYEGASFHRIRD
jgi:hypothetical protein